MPRSTARSTAAARSRSAPGAPHPAPPTAHAPNPRRSSGSVKRRGGPDVSPGPRVHQAAPALGVAGGDQLARLDDLGTMTAGDELLHLDDLHYCLLERARKTAVWSILRVAVTPVNR